MENIFRCWAEATSSPSDFFKQAGSRLWRVCLVTAQTTYDSAAFSLVFAISGVALAIFYPPLSPTFLSIGVSLFTTTLVVKNLDRYHFSMIGKLKTKACTFPIKYAKLHLIAFVFALAISFFSPFTGGIIGGITGIASGVIIQVERLKRLRQVHAENVKNPKSSFKENLAFV